MSLSPKSRAQLTKCAIEHPYERRAVVLLARAGWSYGELAMCFNTSESGIRRLLNSEEGPTHE